MVSFFFFFFSDEKREIEGNVSEKSEAKNCSNR